MSVTPKVPYTYGPVLEPDVRTSDPPFFAPLKSTDEKPSVKLYPVPGVPGLFCIPNWPIRKGEVVRLELAEDETSEGDEEKA